MGKPNKIHVKNYRDRKKQLDPEFTKRENARIEEIRKRRVANMNAIKHDEYRRNARERQRRCRAKRKLLQQNQSSPSSSSASSTPLSSLYSTKQSFGKAVMRVRRSLPKSPRKKRAVVLGMASEFGLDVREDSTSYKFSVRHQSSINEDMKERIKAFYFRPDIVYTMPGMKDVMVVWTSDGKSTLRKHYLTMFLREAYKVYCEENPDDKVGLSTFCNLRPTNVLLLKDSPSDQCKCFIHENFFMKLQALQKPYTSQFWSNFLCDASPNSDCWLSQCDNCREYKQGSEDLNSKANLKQWKRVTVAQSAPESDDSMVETGAKSQTKLQIVMTEMYKGEILDLINNELCTVKEHVNNKRIQAAAFNDDTANVGKRVLHMDFAMSYSCEYQNEVQSALWSRANVTLLTATITKNGQTRSLLICSDVKEKDKNTVFACILYIYDCIIKPSLNDVEEDVIWTDGPSSEFKNKYMVHLLRILSEKFNKKFSWKYFATSHGKGAVDGIGGNAKSLVRKKVMSKANDVIVQSAEDFANVCGKMMKETKVVFLSAESIKNMVDLIQPWGSVERVPGISKMHIVECSDGIVSMWKNVQYKETGIAESEEYDGRSQAVSATFEVGDWVIVTYEDEEYPGEVTATIDGEVEVSVMHPYGGYYKWPDAKDQIYYPVSNVLRKIDAPIVAGSRGQFSFNDI